MLDRLDDWLVDRWRECWRWFSIHWMLATGALLEIVQLTPVIPPEIQAIIPQPWGAIAVAGWTFLGIIARLKRQRESVG
jgi:hypothetical protein